ncbi:MAG: hypothetical protein SH817_04310 [Leptospira sp.]|nr:hypothetical protein [Leptospira sp.]
MFRFGFYLLFYLTALFSISSEEISFKYVHEEYKKGNYETVSRLTKKFLKSTDTDTDPRFFFLYVSTEKDWLSLKKTVQLVAPTLSKNSTFYWNAIYLFMEKALVLGESDLLIKYGKIFQKEGKASDRYTDALFMLAYGLSDLKNTAEALKVLEELEKLNLSEKLKNQVTELNEEIKGSKI